MRRRRVVQISAHSQRWPVSKNCDGRPLHDAERPHGANGWPGIILEVVHGMTKRARRSPHRVISWVFQYGNDLLTCEVGRQSGMYRLLIVPHRSDQPAIVKNFASSVEALQQHAAVAARLREHRWTLIAYSGSSAAERGYQPAA